jgi:hypothetical protein
MDANFSSVYFSSSIHNINNSTSKELKLWFDTDVNPPTLYDSVILPAPGGAGTVTITGDVNNRVLTAAGNGTIQGEQNLTFNGSILTLTGRFEPIDVLGNLSIGTNAGLAATAGSSVLVGAYAGQDLGGIENVAVGNESLLNADQVANTVSIGTYSLTNLGSGNNNTAIGYSAAENVITGTGNMYLGYQAGPETQNTNQSNKLYINNAASNTPLILGDFTTGQVTIKSQVSASLFSGSFVGNGAGLTGVSTEWNGTRNGNAQITGSLIVSGAVGTTVNFKGVSSISGSIFSGSFVGDGSGLTGITANSEWDGTRNGNGEITGSFIVSGSSPTISLRGVTTIDQNIRIYNPTLTSISIGQNALQSTTAADSIGIGRFAGVQASNGPSISIGTQAGQKANGHTIYIGQNAGLNNAGVQVVAIGGLTLFNASTVGATVAIGYRALQGLGGGTSNVGIGDNAAVGLKDGSANTTIGASTLSNLIQGSSNVAIGKGAGSYKVTQGSGNVYLGPYTGRDDISQEDNQLYIDNKQRNNALIRGDFEQRILTLNALQIFMPELLDFQQDPNGVNALPLGALYKDGPFVMVRVP